jgi:PAS domain S-box-containing protein
MTSDAGTRTVEWTRWLRPRSVSWAGGMFIAVIAATAVYDVFRQHAATVANTGRELESHARVIAEQTARSVQAVDVVLRHYAEQFRTGAMASWTAADVHAYLTEQAVGLVQIDALFVFHANGDLLASSLGPPQRQQTINVTGRAAYELLRANRNAGVFVGAAQPSQLEQKYIVPIARRLENASGEFAGIVAARGRTEYFEQFYRDIRLDPGTSVALMRDDGTLLARYPVVESALGKRFPPSEQLLASSMTSAGAPVRLASPIDGIERFVVLRRVPDYPLVVVLTRDAAVALAPWRAQAIGTAARMLGLGILAALLLAVAVRQLRRLSEARESLEASRERFALAVAGSDEGIWLYDFTARQVFVSARARELSGLPPGPETQAMDEWFASLTLHPDDAPQREVAFDAHLAGKTPAYEGEFRLRHPDGAYRWVRIHGVCIRDGIGTPQRMAGSITDVDARKRAEAALRASEERFQLAVAGANQGLWDWDLTSDTLFVSARAQEFMGLVPSEPLRPRREWIERSSYHPDDVESVRRAVSAHLRGRTPCFEIEHRLRHRSGAWHWYRQRGVALTDEHGRPYRMAGSMEDITDRKDAEADRSRLEGQLLQAKKLEAIGTLAGGIAHDFNNILAAILGNAEMAQMDAKPGSALRRHVDAAFAAGMRAKSLVERILAFSRSGIGDRTPVHVQSIVDEALEAVTASLPPHVRLERQLSADDARVLGDPTQIHQVVMNLCTNGIQAMKSSGTLRVSLDAVERSESTAATSVLAAGRYVRLVVRDTGAGIPPAVLERIFDPFFTTKEVGVGTGLGLSLVHGIVTDLGGGIDVESRVGEGSVFTVYLPWSEAVAAAAGVEEVVPRGAGEVVLLVDDEEPLVMLGEDMLARLGYEPVGFTSGVAALAAFRAAPERFDAVLSDESMPEMTGCEMAASIRALRRDIPIVLVSGFVTAALSGEARAIGITEVLAKPLVVRDVARSLANALAGAPRRDVAVPTHESHDAG